MTRVASSNLTTLLASGQLGASPSTTTTTATLPRCPGGQFRFLGECQPCPEGWVPNYFGDDCKEKRTLGMNEVQWVAVGSGAAVVTFIVGVFAAICQWGTLCGAQPDMDALNSTVRGRPVSAADLQANASRILQGRPVSVADLQADDARIVQGHPIVEPDLEARSHLEKA